ncbi:Gas vesicle protein OS=Streptomyces albaduncus OX=68172 GN=FHS32_004668 PE=4 SV=1 [Streptomyces griseoloalbus]
MPADEVTHGAEVEASRVRTGPRHAAPKKPLFTRFHMPAGKAIAIAAMPTAVLMGMGFTPTLAQADDQPSSRNLTADEFKECLEAIEQAEKGDASASPSPSASASESASEDGEEPSPDPSASAPAEQAPDEDADKDADKGSDSSPDSGSDDKSGPAPAPSATADGQKAETEPAPSPSETDRNLLEQIGDTIKDVLTPGEKAEETPSPSPSASASSSAPADEQDDEGDKGASDDKAEEASQKPADESAGDVLDTVGDAAQDATEQAGDAVEEATEEPEATASPSPSESSGTDLEDCPVATDAEGGVDNNVPLPDDPCFLNASSLLLKGADHKGIVEVQTTANGTTRRS